MPIRIGNCANITPRLLPRGGDERGSGLLGLLNQFVDAGFARRCDADKGFALAARRDFPVADNPPEPSCGNEHESQPAIEPELQGFRDAVLGCLTDGAQAKSGCLEVE